MERFGRGRFSFWRRPLTFGASGEAHPRVSTNHRIDALTLLSRGFHGPYFASRDDRPRSTRGKFVDVGMVSAYFRCWGI
jgi:hypothetical protein